MCVSVSLLFLFETIFDFQDENNHILVIVRGRFWWRATDPWLRRCLWPRFLSRADPTSLVACFVRSFGMPRPTRWCRSNCKYKGKGKKNNNISRILLFLQQFISRGLSFFYEPCSHVFNSFSPLASLILQPILINSGFRLLDQLQIFVLIYWLFSFSVSSAFLTTAPQMSEMWGGKDAYKSSQCEKRLRCSFVKGASGLQRARIINICSFMWV